MGIFILLGTVIFIVGVLALGGQRKTFSRTITVHSVFDDVNGLQNGSNIWYAGVKVGTVKKIQFTPAAQVEVLMDIEEKSKKYIHNNARAKIGTDGLIGNKIIVLYGGNNQAPEIKEGDLIYVEKALSMDDMINTFQSNNKNLLEVTENFKTISKRLVNGQGSIGKLLTDETLANNLQTTINYLKATAVSAKQLTAGLADYASKLRAKGSITNELVTDTVIFSHLKSASVRIDALTSSANGVVDQLTRAATSVTNGINNPNTPAGSLLHDSIAAQNIKATMVNMQSASEKLNDDLEALQHNFLLRGFFRKKAQKEKTTEKE